jgi:hypothetical protein
MGNDKKGKKNDVSDSGTSRSRSPSRSDRRSRRKRSKRDDSASPPRAKSSGGTLETFMESFTRKFDKFSLDIKGEFSSFKSTLDKQEEQLDKHDQMLANHDTKFQ